MEKKNVIRLLKSAGLLMTVLVLLLALSYLFIPKSNYEDFGMRNAKANGILGERENSIDVLVVGNSETYAAVTPMQIWAEQGITSYVCGTSGQLLVHSVEFIKQALERQQIRVVILETDTVFAKMPLDTYLSEKAYTLLPVFQYHNRWKNLTANDWGSTISYTFTDDWKGYYYSKNIVPAEVRDYMAKTDEVAPISTWNRVCLSELIGLCKKQGVPLLLMSAPSCKNWNYSRHNAIQAVADENGLPYLDMNLMTEEIPIDWRVDTRDKGDHINQTGAVKATGYLGRYLRENWELPDHRGDAAYASWDRTLKTYEALISG